MNPSAKPSLGLVALLAVATLTGCVSVGTPGSPDTETTTASTTDRFSTADSPSTTDTATVETTVPAPSNASARERAIDAEKARVESALNASNVSGSVGGYDDPGATVVGRADGGVRVRVSVPYSYSYDCEGKAGAADLSTEAVYHVTTGSIRLVEVVEGVRLLC